MNQLDKPEKDEPQDLRITNHELHGFHFTAWLGAMIRYMINLGLKPFNYFYKESSSKLNFRIGLLITILAVIASFIIMIIRSAQ